MADAFALFFSLEHETSTEYDIKFYDLACMHLAKDDCDRINLKFKVSIYS
jgi:hypothetical protein